MLMPGKVAGWTSVGRSCPTSQSVPAPIIDHYNACLFMQICMGGEVPSHHYTNHLNNVDMSLFTTTVVRRGSFLVLDYPVQLPNSVLRYARQLHFTDYMFRI